MTTDTSKHTPATPLPYTTIGTVVCQIKPGPFPIAGSAVGDHVCDTHSDVDAAYIVAACNAYPGLIAERDRLRAALEPVARGACLDQRVGHAEGYRCICFSCIARAALNQDKE